MSALVVYERISYGTTGRHIENRTIIHAVKSPKNTCLDTGVSRVQLSVFFISVLAQINAF